MTWTEFNLEGSPGCTKDYIELREGGPNGSIVGLFCGGNIPPSDWYFGPIYMVFHTDSDVGQGGWYLTWTSNCK